tara:strand:+ start:669 stop:2312 length:1644 start_codon:yes stop_codon:yes gene_type:complete
MNFSRRLLIYFILFITINVYAFGISNLIGWIFDLTGIIGNAETQNIAPFLSAIIVCLPIWIFLWRFSSRTSNNIAEEASSAVRNLYLNLVSGISLIYISISIFSFIGSIIKLDSPINSIPNLIVWVPIFLMHIKPAQEDWNNKNRKRIHEFYLNIVFIISSIIIFISLRGVILNLFDYILILISGDDLILGSSEKINIDTGAIAALLTGSILWFYSWNSRIKKLDLNFRTIDLAVITVSQAFVFLFSIFIILTQSILLTFDISNDSSESLYKKLEFFPELLSFTVVSLFFWIYYSSGFLQTRIKNFYEINSKSIRWIYRYSVRAIAIIFLVSSSVSFLVFILGIPVVISEDNLIGESNWEFQILSASISALIIGILTLRYINLKTQNDSDKNDESVQKSYVYIVAIFFVFLLIGALIAILTILIRGFIGWSFSLATLETIRWPLAFALNSILILWFYRRNIISRFKSNEEAVRVNKNIDVYSLKVLEKYKDNFLNNYKLKSWNTYQNIKKFSSNSKGIGELSETINSLEEKDFVVFENDKGEFYLYY